MSAPTLLLAQLFLATATQPAPAAAGDAAPAPAPAAPAPAAPAPAGDAAAAPAPVAAAGPVAAAPAAAAQTPAASPAPAAAPSPPPPVIVAERVEIRAESVVLPANQIVVHDAPTVPAQRPYARKGTGLLITSGVLGSIAWGATIIQMREVDGCREQLRSGQINNRAYDCAITQGEQLGQATGMKVLANLGTWGVAPAAGAVRGNYDAIDSTWGNKRARRSGFWIGSGVAFTVGGILGSISSAVYLGQPCRSGSCTNELRAYFFAQQLSQSAFSAGLGMFAYGLVYRREYKQNAAYRKRNRISSLRVAPQLTASGGGAAISARF